MDLLAVLAPLAQSPVSVNVPPVDLTVIVSRLVTLVPLIAGYLLAREGRGKLVWEIPAVLLLTLATVTITEPTINMTNLPRIVNDFINRFPIALLLLGLAFVRDGGFKMIVGLLLMAISGVLLPRTI
ncbi:MAG TPA: hypothetical protein VKK19_06630 [Candidatus Dormibacteraeota bacterium]|nr:hypothetical protein [Candidatus Dormibacteraeota bacterium]